MFNLVFFFFKQKPAYLLRISDLSSDVCSSALQQADLHVQRDALKLDRVQVGQEVDRRAGARHQLLPQGDAHGRAVVLAPAKKRRDRKSVEEGKSVSVCEDLGGRRIMKKKKNRQQR